MLTRSHTCVPFFQCEDNGLSTKQYPHTCVPFFSVMFMAGAPSNTCTITHTCAHTRTHAYTHTGLEEGAFGSWQLDPVAAVGAEEHQARIKLALSEQRAATLTIATHAAAAAAGNLIVNPKLLVFLCVYAHL
jgi:hypothetical protein